MKRVFFIMCLLVAGIYSMQAQTDKIRVAVFDPSYSGGHMDEGTAVATREIVSSALVNTNKYNIVERSLLDKILKEQKFSNSGAVNENQVSELGKLVGANKAILIVLTSAGKRALLSIKMVDVESGNVEGQKVTTINPDELLDVIEPLTLSLIGEDAVQKSDKNGSFLSGVFGKKDKKEETPKEEKKKKEKSVERKEEVFSDFLAQGGKDILLEFKGFRDSKNPTATLFLNGRKIGEGTLNEGFYIKLEDIRAGVHELKIEWSGTVNTSTFKIDTNKKDYYEFEYKKTGFGYAFRLKN